MVASSILVGRASRLPESEFALLDEPAVAPQVPVGRASRLPGSESALLDEPAVARSGAGERAEKPPAAPQRRRRKAWSPSARDEVIYQWVRFEGQKQSWVATQFGVSQATISRVVRRYDLWKLRSPEEAGTLCHATRRHLQRQLTFDRNEHIIASALRLADRVEERAAESTKDVFHRDSLGAPQNAYVQESKTLDQAGVAARFLRLAFRVNMEQYRLVESEPLPPLAPQSEEELDRELAEAEADEAALNHEERRPHAGAKHRGSTHDLIMDFAEYETRTNAASVAEVGGFEMGAEEVGEQLAQEGEELGEDSAEASTEGNAEEELNVHKMHTADGAGSDATASLAGACDVTHGEEKKSRCECMGREEGDGIGGERQPDQFDLPEGIPVG